MPDLDFALVASALTLAFLVVALAGRGRGGARHTVRVVLGTGAACAGAALLVASLLELP